MPRTLQQAQLGGAERSVTNGSKKMYLHDQRPAVHLGIIVVHGKLEVSRE